MQSEEVEEQLRRVFVAYPSYREWLAATGTPSETLTAWCNMITPCDHRDVARVVDDIVSGTRPPIERFDKPDAMPRRIRELAGNLRSARNLKQDQEQHHSGKRINLMEWVKQDRTGCIAVWLGEQVRAKALSREENDSRMEELLAWDKGGPKPGWME